MLTQKWFKTNNPKSFLNNFLSMYYCTSELPRLYKSFFPPRFAMVHIKDTHVLSDLRRGTKMKK